MRGFTLIEIIVVIGILGAIAAYSLGTTLTSYQGYSFRDERDTFIGTLQKARSESLNNVCNGSLCVGPTSHGVHIEPDKYVLFQGETYDSHDSENISTAINSLITMSGFHDVLFAPLSAKASTSPSGIWSVVLTDSTGHISTTTIGSDGEISWTN